jgi:hypothetical protein
VHVSNIEFNLLYMTVVKSRSEEKYEIEHAPTCTPLSIVCTFVRFL